MYLHTSIAAKSRFKMLECDCSLQGLELLFYSCEFLLPLNRGACLLYHHKRTASFMSKSRAVDTGWSWSPTTGAQKSMKTQALIKIPEENGKLMHLCECCLEVGLGRLSRCRKDMIHTTLKSCEINNLVFYRLSSPCFPTHINPSDRSHGFT